MKNVATLQDLRESGDPETHLSNEIVTLAEKIDWEDQSLSFRDLREYAVKNYRALKEANPSSAFGQLLRAGIQQIANGWYDRTEVTYPKYVVETASDKRQEFYAPLFGSDLPHETGQGEEYTRQEVIGLDRELINRKFMGGETFTRELFDDDQTGQIRQRASNLGKGSKVWEEIYVASRMRGTATNFQGRAIAASTFTTENADGTAITTPFDENLYATGEGNRPAAFVQLAAAPLKVAYEALQNAKDPLGIKILNDINILLVSPFDTLNSKMLANSGYYPGVPGTGAQTASTAASGSLTGSFGDNIFKGLFNIEVNRYLDQGQWFLGDAKQGPVFQRRDPLEVVQEQPLSGKSFDTDAYRFRSRARWEMDWIDSRFWYMGNDGTAVVAQ